MVGSAFRVFYSALKRISIKPLRASLGADEFACVKKSVQKMLMPTAKRARRPDSRLSDALATSSPNRTSEIGAAMDRFYEMQIFIAVAEEDGFAAAARRLNISPPTVTRAIASIEERIGAQLLSRSTRSMHLSEIGQRYLEDCRRILSELEAAEDAAAGSHSTPCGNLTLTAPVIFGELFVAPNLVEYMNRFPEVTLNAMLVDRVVSLADEGVDVGIRIGHLQDAGQVSVKVGEVSLVVCASPQYLNRVGRPQHPNDLAGCNIVSSSASHLLSDWQFMRNEKPISFRPSPQLIVTDNKAAINVACLGWGMTRVLSYQVANFVESGKLEVVLRDFQPPPLPIHIVYQKIARVPAKTSTFVNFLAERLLATPSLQQ
jgi:DNA-binding transcriptional LysR family regulator